MSIRERRTTIDEHRILAGLESFNECSPLKCRSFRIDVSRINTKAPELGSQVLDMGDVDTEYQSGLALS